MATETLAHFPTQLETLFHHGALGGLTDGELLARFLSGYDRSAEAAFAVLVERHAPMVMRVCRGALGTTHDAEDASQAVFLVLARRAHSIRRSDSAASWLYGVARRVAARARRDAARRRKHERGRAEMAATRIEAPVVPDACEGIYAEIDALPEIYRSAFVLCYLEGLSHEQAARSLRCPLRTFQSRLLRAKERLRERLARRGASLPAVLPPLANALPPSAVWVKTTAAAARAFAAGQAPLATAGVSDATVSLARSSLRAAVYVPRLIAGAVLTAGLAALVIAVASGGSDKTDPPFVPLQAGEPSVVTPPEKDPNNRTLILRAVHRDTRAPIEGAEVTVEFDSGARAGLGGDAALFTRLTTDSDGRCRIEFPRVLPKEIYITARKVGYADRAYGPFFEPGRHAIPRGHTIEMERGVTIGGIVKNRQGQAIVGATVIIMARAGAGGASDWSYVSEVKVTTDAEGRWRYGEMPTGWESIYLRVTHPDYVPTFMQREVPKPSDLLLKARKEETILEEGVALAGRVVDDRGRPIAGAKVGLGADRLIMQRDYPSVATDAEGRFRFGHVPTGPETVTAQALGRAPERADVVVAPGMQPVELRLGPGHLIRGRAVNPQGQPLDGVTVQAMDWKEHFSLDWTTKTDAEGRFTWDSAPAEPVSLTLTKPGYIMVGQREFRADRGETTVTMYPPLRVRGRVTDARTGRPIQRFSVVHGNYHRYFNQDGALRNVNWERGGKQADFTGGAYEVEFTHPHVAAVAMRVEAQGYKPATSEPFRMEAGDVTFDARLEPGEGPSGVVHGSDGRPLVGAAVILSTTSVRAQLFNGRFHESAYPRVLTGADGRFTFPAQTEPFHVFVDHESGFAAADARTLAGSSPLAIRPWGRIEGIVKIGTRPTAGVQVRLAATDDGGAPNEAVPLITQIQRTSTDARGRYAFEHVIPARLVVSRGFTPERSSSQEVTLSARTVWVKSGRTTFADLGGTGRPVVGRFALPGRTKADGVFPYYNQTLHRIGPEPPYPRDLGGEERQAWLREWLATDEGEAYCSSERSFDTNVRPDGRFRIEDVPAGKYQLHAHVREPAKDGPGTLGPELASIDIEITVPEVPGGRSDVPLDLGTIELKPSKPPASD
jgi:RNA polymerase sigma factor (sigma-70 family)